MSGYGYILAISIDLQISYLNGDRYFLFVYKSQFPDPIRTRVWIWIRNPNPNQNKDQNPAASNNAALERYDDGRDEDEDEDDHERYEVRDRENERYGRSAGGRQRRPFTSPASVVDLAAVLFICQIHTHTRMHTHQIQIHAHFNTSNFNSIEFALSAISSCPN